ncbi:hypothetical protein FACS1894188_07910 [Clostridia bacterium]|nr:hypothetical protein FACS1894188_07910 [Clostridia bacterium]
MTYTDLCGTDYSLQARRMGRTFFQPNWYESTLETKVLVIDNFTEIPPKSETDLSPDDDGFGEECPCQVEYLFLCRDANESDEARKLNFGSPYGVPKDVCVYIIRHTGSPFHIIEPIASRAAFIDISKQEVGKSVVTINDLIRLAEQGDPVAQCD